MKRSYTTDRTAMAFLAVSLMYLLAGLAFGVLGGFQYLLPPFLKEQLSFQKMRPLHVYLVISWIFTAAQGCIYYFIPRYIGRNLVWPSGVRLHLLLQVVLSLGIMVSFFMGAFSGREYLEFPAWFGLLIMISWIPFAINFFGTIKPDYRKAPVYIWSWSAGIVFFYITMAESYLWVLDHFRTNIIRDVTVQWKALGSMVGSWNMLVYGTSIFIMEKITGEEKMARNPVAFFFFFLGLTNLMFNWGHHTYIVPAAPWVQHVAYIISMTELLILGHIIYKWRKTLSAAQKNFHVLPYRFLSFADGWIFLNLTLAIAISVPAINYYTHGTHITVAHAMGATIGINTMLLFGAVLYVLHQQKPQLSARFRNYFSKGGVITNISLAVFWAALIGLGLVKISGKLDHLPFQKIMEQSVSLFRLFTFSGLFILAGILVLIIAALNIIFKKESAPSPFNKQRGTRKMIEV